MNLLSNQSDDSSQSGSSRKSEQTELGFNPQMLVIAREARELTQKGLADKIGVAQGTISKLEDGLLQPSTDIVQKLEDALEFPKHFFAMHRRFEWSTPGVGIYRRRVVIPALLLKRCEAQMNIIKLSIAQLLSAAEPPEVRLPGLDPEEHGGVKKVAKMVRLAFGLPPGPVRNLITAMEAAGCIVVPFDFGTRKIDGCSMFIGGVPVVFINTTLNAVRQRWTLAHELAHLVMHRVPTDSDEQEEQANRFAAEFMMPEEDIKGSLLPLNIDRLARHKLRWRISMQAILYHAKTMSVVSERTHRYYCMLIGKLGYREAEPYDNDIPKESPALLRELVDMHLRDLAVTTRELAHTLAIGENDLATWFLGRPSLRVV